MIPFDKSSEIPVMEDFYTIQGEGYHQGRAAYFIRLAGCDVGCHWCDVKESWEAAPEQVTPIEQLLERMDTFPTGICVITGGEPSIYDLGPLTEMLAARGWKVHIETSGAYAFSGRFDWICVSPKKFQAALPDWLDKADEIKVIVYNRSDLEWGETFVRPLQAQGDPETLPRYYLQPEWDREKLVLPLMTEYVKEHPHWSITLQVHKYLGVD